MMGLVLATTVSDLPTIFQSKAKTYEGIAQGEQLGSGDQGIMFGYACRETSELVPLPIHSHQLR